VDNLSMAQEIINGKEEKTDALTSSLLGSAFGSKPKKKTVTISASEQDKFLFVFLKEVICGVAEVENQNIKSLYLKEEFKDQGLSSEVVGAYL
jgi:hypothetical protein